MRNVGCQDVHFTNQSCYLADVFAVEETNYINDDHGCVFGKYSKGKYFPLIWLILSRFKLFSVVTATQEVQMSVSLFVRKSSTNVFTKEISLSCLLASEKMFPFGILSKL